MTEQEARQDRLYHLISEWAGFYTAYRDINQSDYARMHSAGAAAGYADELAGMYPDGSDDHAVWGRQARHARKACKEFSDRDMAAEGAMYAES